MKLHELLFTLIVYRRVLLFITILFHLKMMSIRAREVSNQLRPLADLLGDLGLVPSTHMVPPHNSQAVAPIPGDLALSSGLCGWQA